MVLVSAVRLELRQAEFETLALQTRALNVRPIQASTDVFCLCVYVCVRGRACGGVCGYVIILCVYVGVRGFPQQLSQVAIVILSEYTWRWSSVYYLVSAVALSSNEHHGCCRRRTWTASASSYSTSPVWWDGVHVAAQQLTSQHNIGVLCPTIPPGGGVVLLTMLVSVVAVRRCVTSLMITTTWPRCEQAPRVFVFCGRALALSSSTQSHGVCALGHFAGNSPAAARAR